MADKRMEIVIDGNARGAIDASKQANNAMNNLAGTLKGLAITGGVLFLTKKGFEVLGTAINKTFGFIRDSLDTAADFQKYQTILKTVLGSTEAAVKKMEWIKNFAKSTPFEIPGLVEATVRLAAYGIDAEKVLGTLGDTAAAMGKDVMSAVEALADAQTGEFERLKEFGIKAIQESGQTFLLYTDKYGKEQKALIDRNNREIITSTITAIWNEKYEGGMKELSGTWEGMMSNLADAWTQFKGTVGDGVLKTLSGYVSELLGAIDRLKSEGKLDEWAETISGWISTALEKIIEFIEIATEADYSNIAKGLSDMGAAFQVITSTEGGAGDAANQYQKFVDVVGEGLQDIAVGVASLKAIYSTLYWLIGGLLNTAITVISILPDLGTAIASLGTDKGAVQNIKDKWAALEWFTQATTDNMMNDWDAFNTYLQERNRESTTVVEEQLNEMTNQGIDHFNVLTQKSDESSKTITDHWSTFNKSQYENYKESSDKVIKQMGEMSDQGISNFTSLTLACNDFQKTVDGLHGKDFESHHTIITTEIFQTVGEKVQNYFSGGGIVGFANGGIADNIISASKGINIPKFDDGGMLAMLHPPEIVLNAKEAMQLIWNMANHPVRSNNAGESSANSYSFNINIENLSNRDDADYFAEQIYNKFQTQSRLG